MNDFDGATTLIDLKPNNKQFLQDVMSGLKSSPKSLPCKYLYDQRGSELFDEICELDEYYLTRAEDEIIKRHAREMAVQLGAGVQLVEYGSGSSTKTRALLDELIEPAAYVPVDISREHLDNTAQALSEVYRHIEIMPVCADFTKPFALPSPRKTPTHAAVFFPGSTIGNFMRAEVLLMLSQIADMCGRGGGLLIGVDLQKDIDVIESAYNDSQGITAEFNLNLLQHINRELDGDFDLEKFEHRAIYDHVENRVEISLASLCDQDVTICDELVRFDEQEQIITEYSHKYTIEDFAKLAAEVGLTLRKSWTDENELFALLHLVLL